jgi:hypothetical protein
VFTGRVTCVPQNETLVPRKSPTRLYKAFVTSFGYGTVPEPLSTRPTPVSGSGMAITVRAEMMVLHYMPELSSAQGIIGTGFDTVNVR